MFEWLVRIVFLVVGLVALVEAWLPIRAQQLQLDRHSRGGTGILVWSNSDYNLHFIGSRPLVCKVGHQAYTTLQDGEAVVVELTRFLRSCTRIARGDDVIEQVTYWRIGETVVALLALAVAFGWWSWRDHDDDLSLPWLS